MRKSENHPLDVRTNNVGATRDVDPELSGAENKGTYFDSENGRVTSDRGNTGAWEKIRGEVITHSSTQAGDWFNLVSIPVHSDVFEIWVEKTGADSPYISINGVIMGQSPKMPWLYEHRIQFDKNESCIGGEVFLTDNNTSPTIFSIKDIKDNYAAGNQTYFDDFNLNLYGIGLSYALDSVVFDGLVDLGSGGGLKCGSYQYSLRYINEDGDATNWSPLTPPIPVIANLSSASAQYPYAMTHGGAVGADSKYGIKLKFRVTNLNDYDFLEIRRISYNQGLNIDNVPSGVIVSRIDIDPGEVSIKEFIDPKDSNIDEEVIAESVEFGQLASIARAKAIRYYDKRIVLMNVETTSKSTSDVSISDYNGEKIFPIVENLGKAGFNDPVAHTYKKNYQSNEKYSFGINLFDGFGGSGFVVEDDALKNVEAPSRRDPVSGNSLDLSDTTLSIAANVNSVVTPTFEVFSHENAIKKTDECTFKNILDAGSKPKSDVNKYCSDTNNGSRVGGDEVGYKPFTPVNENSIDVYGHNYRINQKVYLSNGDDVWYEPKGFGCDYYSRGFAIGGVNNIPSWAKAFSVVKSERAGRVVCQGIGTYKLELASDQVFDPSGLIVETAKKKKNIFIFTSPELESAVVGVDVNADMIENPQNYDVIFSSPLGFFSEVYSFFLDSVGAVTDKGEITERGEFVTYARILRDNGEINPGEDAAMGVNGYVAYNRYRNTGDNAGQGAFNTPEGGNKVFGVKSISALTYKSLKIELYDNLYSTSELSNDSNNDFDDQDMKDFTEPFYICNIVKKGALVEDLNVNSYRGTGHYQKIESIIGLGDGNQGQSFELVDERWEDCIPSLTSTGFNNDGESFIFLQPITGIEKRFLNVTYYTPSEVNLIVNDISIDGFHTTPLGFEVRGVYTHSVVGGVNYIDFSNPNYYPLEGDRIIVRYDNARPVKFFGGDTTVGENIFNHTRETMDGFGSEYEIGIPFRRYEVNPRHFIIRKTTGIDKIQNVLIASTFKLNQYIMYSCESIASSSYSFEGETGCFPSTNFVMHPHKYKDDPSSDNIFDQYYVDYPYINFNVFEGILSDRRFNTDYSVKGPVSYFSQPKVGFEENNIFCTGIVWSLPRAVNQQNSPGLKTFPETNRYYLNDDNGEIKKAWSSRTDGKGENLYAVTKSGVALLITEKAILSNLDADDLTVTSVDSFISQEYWINQEVGSDDEMWRGMADSTIELSTESGKMLAEALFIPNRNSIYRLMNNQIKEIAKGNYYSRIHDSLQNLGSGYDTHITGHFDKIHNEYWLQIPDYSSSYAQKCFVFSQDTLHFIGRFDYSFDKYIMKDSISYGFRDGKMYELNKGFFINGDVIKAKLIQHTSLAQVFEKEFISIEINTGLRTRMRPTAINILNEDQVVLARIDEATFGPEYLKQYDGWWAQIPRKMESVSQDRDRIQYRLIMFEIIHTFEEDFKVVSSVVQYKPLK